MLQSYYIYVVYPRSASKYMPATLTLLLITLLLTTGARPFSAFSSVLPLRVLQPVPAGVNEKLPLSNCLLSGARNTHRGAAMPMATSRSHKHAYTYIR